LRHRMSLKALARKSVAGAIEIIWPRIPGGSASVLRTPESVHAVRTFALLTATTGAFWSPSVKWGTTNSLLRGVPAELNMRSSTA